MTTPVEPVVPEPPATPAPEAAPPVENKPEELPQWARDAISKANKEAANYRTQVAELKPKADQFAVLEEASKSEAQRLADAAATAQQQLAAAQADAARYKAAATFGIPADHFDLLGSGSEDEITARAEKISQLLKAQVATPPPGAPQTRPVEQLRPGATPAGAVDEDEAVYASLFGPGK